VETRVFINVRICKFLLIIKVVKRAMVAQHFIDNSGAKVNFSIYLSIY